MLSHERRKNTVVIRLTGDLDHNAANRLRPEIDELLRDAAIDTLVFDVRGLEFMDSSGIGMMIGRYKTMAKRGGTVAVAGAKRRVDQIFKMAGLYAIIQKWA